MVGHVGHLLNVRKKGSAVRVHYQCDKDVTVHDAWAECFKRATAGFEVQIQVLKHDTTESV